jgi:hypothetical protein
MDGVREQDDRGVRAGRERHPERSAVLRRLRSRAARRGRRGQSLHLNLADDHRRLSNPAKAREHLATAHDLVKHLPDDQYGKIRGGIQNVTQALDAGSTEPLESHPSSDS